MKHAIIVTHGPIGDAMIKAVDSIMGITDGLFELAVTDMSVAEITERLLSLVTAPEEKQDGVIIMASLKGGSCWNVSVSIAMKHKNVRVVSGVNLPMVLSFLSKRESMDLDELSESIEQEAIRGITHFQENY